MNPNQKRQIKRNLSSLVKVWAWLTIGAFALVVAIVAAVVVMGSAAGA